MNLFILFSYSSVSHALRLVPSNISSNACYMPEPSKFPERRDERGNRNLRVERSSIRAKREAEKLRICPKTHFKEDKYLNI